MLRPGADEPGQAEDLAAPQIERDVAKAAFEAQVLDRQDDLADRHGLFGKHLGDLAADHHANDVVARDARGGMLADEAAVAEHRDLVGDLEQLAHLVGDVDDAFAFGLQPADDAEEVRDLPFGQRRSRLVHDQDVGVVGDRLGDLDHLPVGDAEIAHFGVGIDMDIEAGEQRLGAAPHLVVSNQTEGVERLAADPDVFRHRHEVHQVEFLMDHRDAVAQRVERRTQADVLALEAEGAGVWRIDAGDDLHQRRLAGAVLAHQRMDVAALEAERHVVERQNAGERFAHVLDFEQVFGARHGPALANDLGGRGGEHGARAFAVGEAPPFRRAPRCDCDQAAARRAGARRAAFRGQFFFSKLAMLAGVTNWKGM